MRSTVDRGRGLSEVLVLRIRDVAGEADPVAARRALAGDRGVAAEAVDHHALGRTLISTRRTSGQASRTCTTIGLPVSFDERDVGPQHPDLILGRRVHPEVVEAALPHTDHPRVVQQLLDPGAAASRRTRTRRADACPRWRTHPRGDRPARADRRSFPRRHRRRSAGRRRRPSRSRPHLQVRWSSRNRWQWVSTAPVSAAGSRFWSLTSGELTRVSTYGRWGELHVKHDSGKPHP